MIFYRYDLHHTGLNFGRIQNFVHNIQEHHRGIFYIIGIYFDILSTVFTENHFIHTKDGIDRRSDFMGNFGEKLGFRLIGPFCFYLCLLKLFGQFCFFQTSTDNMVDTTTDESKSYKNQTPWQNKKQH